MSLRRCPQQEFEPIIVTYLFTPTYLFVSPISENALIDITSHTKPFDD